MIPVTPQPEPASFDAKVRKKGHQWLKKHGLPQVGGRPPGGPELEPYWRDCLDELHEAYGGVCAYVAVYIYPVVGGRSVDHMVPTSQDLAGAYEWGNYRLACSHINGCKSDATDVLDPFDLAPGTFELEPIFGTISVSKALLGPERDLAQLTIDRLKLNSPDCLLLRAKHYADYRKYCLSKEFLREQSPFVWYELNRQGLL